MKSSSFFIFRGYDLRVIVLVLLAALLLGVLNNLRQPTEQRVDWLGGAPAVEAGADADAQDDEDEDDDDDDGGDDDDEKEGQP